MRPKEKLDYNDEGFQDDADGNYYTARTNEAEERSRRGRKIGEESLNQFKRDRYERVPDVGEGEDIEYVDHSHPAEGEEQEDA